MKRMLPAIFKQLLALMAVSHGTVTFCNITEGETQYYGAVGQSVFINLMRDKAQNTLEVKFNKTTFFKMGNNGNATGKCRNHCDFFRNGTFKLDKVTKNLSGTYLLDLFDVNGKNVLSKHINLTIQDPVSHPELSQLCLPHGEIQVSASCTGEQPQYHWTLDNHPLDKGVAFLSNDTVTVILKRNISGSITCTVSNHASMEHTTQRLLTCPGYGAPVTCTLSNGTKIEVSMNASLNASRLYNTEIFFRVGGAEEVSAVCNSRPHVPNKTSDNCQQTSHFILTDEHKKDILIALLIGTSLILLILLMGMCYLYKKKQKQPKKSQRRASGKSALQSDESEDPQELMYCQVQVARKREGKKKHEQEPQVVYGEVKVSNNPEYVRHTPKGQADTVYSSIRT